MTSALILATSDSAMATAESLQRCFGKLGQETIYYEGSKGHVLK